MASEPKNDSLYLRYRLNTSIATEAEGDEELGSLKISLSYQAINAAEEGE